MVKSPCETCGACCAFFRVVFPTIEIDGGKTLAVPMGVSSIFDVSQSVMNGTEKKSPRCMALKGTVGSGVTCTIYENRPSTCRNFKKSWENNTGNFLCDRARSVFGLQPFSQY